MSKTTQRKQSFFSAGKAERIEAMRSFPKESGLHRRIGFVNSWYKIAVQAVPKPYRGPFYAGWCSAAKRGVK